MLRTGVRRIVVVLGIFGTDPSSTLSLAVLRGLLSRAWVGVSFAGAAEGAEEGKERYGSEEGENGSVWGEEKREEDIGSEERVVGRGRVHCGSNWSDESRGREILRWKLIVEALR